MTSQPRVMANDVTSTLSPATCRGHTGSQRLRRSCRSSWRRWLGSRAEVGDGHTHPIDSQSMTCPPTQPRPSQMHSSFQATPMMLVLTPKECTAEAQPITGYVTTKAPPTVLGHAPFTHTRLQTQGPSHSRHFPSEAPPTCGPNPVPGPTPHHHPHAAGGRAYQSGRRHQRPGPGICWQ